MAEAVMGPLVGRLQELAVTEAWAMVAVNDDVRSLRDKLMWMQAFLREAEPRRRAKNDELIRVCLQQTRDAVFDAEDAVDQYFLQVDLSRCVVLSPDHSGYGHGNSEIDDDSSCSDDNNRTSKRQKALDDALFCFFRDQAVNSLKRNFSTFCKEINVRDEIKRQKVGVMNMSSFTRFSSKYFSSVVKKITPHQRSVIEKFGFGCLLHFDISDIPSGFICWIARHVDSVSSQIIIAEKVIPISKKSVHRIFALPNGGEEIVSDHIAGRDFILSFFQLTEIPHITFFGNKLEGSDDLNDHEVFVCFMVVAMSCLLCPSSRAHPSLSYVSILQDPNKTRGFDLCKLVYDFFIMGINKFKKVMKSHGRIPKDFHFCTYFLAVRYLDCLDFGAQNIDQTLPRILSWRGNMIKRFSELDKRSKKIFGSRKLKLKNCTVAKHHSIIEDDMGALSSSRESMHLCFGPKLCPEAIDGVFDIVQSFYSLKHDSSKLLSNLLSFMSGTTFACTCGGIHRQSKPNGGAGIVDPPAKLDFQKGQDDNSDPTTLAKTDHQEGQHDKALPVTPDCVITKVVDSSAAKEHKEFPMKKVKARFCRLITNEEELNIVNSDEKGVGVNFANIGALDDKELNSSVKIIQKIKEGAHLVSQMSPISRFTMSQPSIGKQGGTATAIMKESLVAPNNHYQSSDKCVDGLGHSAIKSSNPSNSPDVQITGTTSFRERCSVLAKKSDAAYNNLIHSRTTEPNLRSNRNKMTSRQGTVLVSTEPLTNSHPIVYHVKDLAGGRSWGNNVTRGPTNSFANQNIRFPVSDEDIANYHAIISLSMKESGYSQHDAIVYIKVHCNYESLGQSLMPDGHVDNFLVPCFCRKLFHDSHPSISGKHHFFSYIGESILKYETERNMTLIRTSFVGAGKASLDKRLGRSVMLQFPICLDKHWFLFVVHLGYQLFAFLDSFYSSESDYHEEIRGPMINNFIHLWEEIVDPIHSFDKFRILYPKVPRQRNLHDCGVFMMKCMEIWDPTVTLSDQFNVSDIANIRIQYANQLYFSNQNTVDKNVVTNYYH